MYINIGLNKKMSFSFILSQGLSTACTAHCSTLGTGVVSSITWSGPGVMEEEQDSYQARRTPSIRSGDEFISPKSKPLTADLMLCGSADAIGLAALREQSC
jgi:hypothetical protein